MYHKRNIYFVREWYTSIYHIVNKAIAIFTYVQYIVSITFHVRYETNDHVHVTALTTN